MDRHSKLRLQLINLFYIISLIKKSNFMNFIVIINTSGEIESINALLGTHATKKTYYPRPGMEARGKNLDYVHSIDQYHTQF